MELGAVDDWSLYDLQAWKRWQEKYADLSDHCSTTAPLLSSEPTTFLEIFRGLSQSGSELENLSLRFKHHSSLKALWLNLNITCPDPSTLSLLKTCDYSTVYTKTHHWRKVRAAMLLINNAHCADCIGSESHYGVENQTFGFVILPTQTEVMSATRIRVCSVVSIISNPVKRVTRLPTSRQSI